MKKIKIGILGLGHLGKIHLKCLKQTNFEVVGYYDPNPKVSGQIEDSIKSFDSIDDLLLEVEAIDIVSTTTTHFELIMKSVKAGKHIFVEKPICYELNQIEEIIAVLPTHLILQVGHVERFNPAFIPIKNKIINPMFIEGHRIATFNPRGTDVSVVLDLMIHDIDIVCSLVNSSVTNISASGVSIVSDTPDIANARIEFTNGCVANLTASRISMKQMRKLRLFGNDSYVSIDFLEKELNVIKLEEEIMGNEIPSGFELETSKGKRYVNLESPEIIENNAIVEELKAFYNSIQNGAKVEAGIKEAHQSLKIALEIIQQIKIKETKYGKN